MGKVDSDEGSSHIPVLLDEVLENLVGSTTGTYVDATFGRGGHSRALLSRLQPEARLVVIDRDPAAIADANTLAAADMRVTVCQARFSSLAAVLAEHAVQDVQGVLMDLGVSSPQLDAAARGFSFLKDGPLDMRMDPESGESAADWLNTAEPAEIARVLKDYGEERFARRIARAIIAARPLQTTAQLAEVVEQAVPGRVQQKHPATRTFQAVRMYVNAELDELEQGLQAAFDALAPGGRLAVISFHSLEDREVKHTFRTWTRPPPLPRRVPVRHQDQRTQARDVAGPLRPSAAELARNPRARSATLRVIEKAAQDG